jgi:rhodanese-related sulfurtransferase
MRTQPPIRAALVIVAFVVAACGPAGTGEAPSGAAGHPSGAAGHPSDAAGPTVPREVSVTEAARLRDEGALVLDVRQPDEWATGHVPGATLIPLGELEGRTAELPRDRTIVVICRSGNRSAQGRDVLLAAGFDAVTSVAGGMTAWQGAGLDVDVGG